MLLPYLLAVLPGVVPLLSVKYSTKYNNGTGTFLDSETSTTENLEDLAYVYGTDKSYDDHGYVKFYDMVLGPKRNTITNMTEIGVSVGQSIQMWAHYFPKATVHGIDSQLKSIARDNLAKVSNVRLYEANLLLPCCGNAGDLGIAPNTMDLIIEDGPHTADSQEKFLLAFWRTLRPGGVYVIEDIGSAKGEDVGGLARFRTHPERLSKETREILHSSDCMLIDTAIGHRNWSAWKEKNGKYTIDRVEHNSYMLVIKKRSRPQHEIRMHLGKRSMSEKGIIQE